MLTSWHCCSVFSLKLRVGWGGDQFYWLSLSFIFKIKLWLYFQKCLGITHWHSLSIKMWRRYMLWCCDLRCFEQRPHYLDNCWTFQYYEPFMILPSHSTRITLQNHLCHCCILLFLFFLDLDGWWLWWYWGSKNSFYDAIWTYVWWLFQL